VRKTDAKRLVDLSAVADQLGMTRSRPHDPIIRHRIDAELAVEAFAHPTDQRVEGANLSDLIR
jgi:hypothetical protein